MFVVRFVTAGSSKLAFLKGSVPSAAATPGAVGCPACGGSGVSAGPGDSGAAGFGAGAGLGLGTALGAGAAAWPKTGIEEAVARSAVRRLRWSVIMPT